MIEIHLKNEYVSEGFRNENNTIVPLYRLS